MHFKQAAAATVLVSTLIVISGCSSAEYGIAALDREAAAEDRLPDVVIDESVNADSVRKVAEQHQVAYFVGVMNDDQGYCAYAVDNDAPPALCYCGSTCSPASAVAPNIP
ncbi:hypothetical protein [Arthrobacter ruber]|uniref:hypothetical protein n=1 Tax=Arthrobacter ruber TaxID=1258893 RepID=UPI0013000D1D|nr:hypothetical protein [Arthrobacter ruber]